MKESSWDARQCIPLAQAKGHDLGGNDFLREFAVLPGKCPIETCTEGWWGLRPRFFNLSPVLILSWIIVVGSCAGPC